MGLFELRNLVEAVILTVPALYLCIAFLPFGLTAKIIVTLVVVVPVGGFGLTVKRITAFMRRFICFPAMRPVRSSFKLWPYLTTV